MKHGFRSRLTPDWLCEVCHKRKPVGVFAGPGPASFAYCQTCLDAGASPYWMLVAYLTGLTRELVHAGCQEEIQVTCYMAGKSVDQFWIDVETSGKEYDAYMDKEYKLHTGAEGER